MWENPNGYAELVENFHADTVMTAMKAILFETFWVLDPFCFSFDSKQAPDGWLGDLGVCFLYWGLSALLSQGPSEGICTLNIGYVQAKG